jgi:L-ribulose-5-phosphate 4-epimerase
MEMNITELKRDLLTACKILSNKELIRDFGHVSVRVDSEKFLIPTRKSPALVLENDLLLVNLDGKILEGKGEKYSETWIHSEIYKRRDDVGAVVHSHSINAIAVSSSQIEFGPIYNQGYMFLNVPVFKEVGLINTKEKAKRMVELLGESHAILLRGHGAVIVGKDIKEATLKSIYLEENARILILAGSLGEPVYLREEESEKIGEDVFNPSTIKRAWDYYNRLYS